MFQEGDDDEQGNDDEECLIVLLTGCVTGLTLPSARNATLL